MGEPCAHEIHSFFFKHEIIDRNLITRTQKLHENNEIVTQNDMETKERQE